MKVLVGLGNPGSKYEGNRHNVGFMAIDAIARHYGVTQWRQRFHGQAAEIDIDRVRYLLLKPMTYMNESGRAVGEATRFYKMSPADVIVFHDELDLEPGKIRAKSGGGHAGHNGLKSITAHIGNDYQRVRIGIGHPGHRDLVSQYVLNDFARSDSEWLDPLLSAIATALPHLVAGNDPKFLNEVARTMRPAPVSRKADAAPIVQQPAAAAAIAEPAPAKSEPAPAAPEPEVIEPQTVATASDPTAPAVQQPAVAAAITETAPAASEPAPSASEPEATEPQPAATASDPADQAAQQQQPAPDPAPAGREKELETAGAAAAGPAQAQSQAQTGGLGSKLKKWFGRG